MYRYQTGITDPWTRVIWLFMVNRMDLFVLMRKGEVEYIKLMIRLDGPLLLNHHGPALVIASFMKLLLLLLSVSHLVIAKIFTVAVETKDIKEQERHNSNDQANNPNAGGLVAKVGIVTKMQATSLTAQRPTITKADFILTVKRNANLKM